MFPNTGSSIRSGTSSKSTRLESGSYVLIAVAGEKDRVQSSTLAGLSFEASRLFED